MLQPQRLWQPIKSFLGETREIGSHSSYVPVFWGFFPDCIPIIIIHHPPFLALYLSYTYPFHILLIPICHIIIPICHIIIQEGYISIIYLIYLSYIYPIISSYPYHFLSSLISPAQDLLLIGSPLDPPKSHSGSGWWIISIIQYLYDYRMMIDMIIYMIMLMINRYINISMNDKSLINCMINDFISIIILNYN